MTVECGSFPHSEGDLAVSGGLVGPMVKLARLASRRPY
jgi:hypothetical protein